MIREVLSQMTPRYHEPQELKVVASIYNCPQPIAGYSMPQIREAVRVIAREHLAGQSDRQVWDYWHRIWKESPPFEDKMAAITYWTMPRHYPLAMRYFQPLLEWAADLDNWAHSDGLSSIYVKFLEDLGSPVDRTLLKWNRSRKPWLRRQSVVSLLYYTRQRRRTPRATRVLEAIEPLLGDDHYYVQKGVGWTLREVYQVDKKLTLEFIEEHLHAIQPPAYTAAVEKLPLAMKKKLRDERASKRKRG